MRRAVVLLAVLLAGCGAGAEDGGAPEDVSVVVSRDYGARTLDSDSSPQVSAGDTVMRMLQREFEVETRYGGGFVQSIEGLSGTDGRDRADWFYYVNGIEASEGAAERKLAPGDQVWWDRHNWDAAQRVPAVVGSFPEPFLSGQNGKRLPVALVCAAEERTCDEVVQRLGGEGVEGVSRVGIGAGFGQKLLRVLVGPWSEIRRDPAAGQLERGPAGSGVFVRPRAAEFELLDETGAVTQRVSGGAGLVAATRFQDQQPTWLVTGTDDAGVAAAAAALKTDVLDNRFAVAVLQGRAVPLPTRASP